MKTKYKVIIGVVAVLWILAFFTNDKDTDVADAESTKTEISTEQETEPQTETIETELNVDDLTEEEYKAMCEEIFDDEKMLLEDKLYEGQYVKMQVSPGSAYSYERFDTFGCIIDDLIEEYDLEDVYYKCGVLHEEFSKPNLPVYGDLVFLLIDKASPLSIDDFESARDRETGRPIVIYGEVVQMWSGPFIIPHYIEVVK